jgi:glycosyltransferase involved in cell wall biosynthesis
MSQDRGHPKVTVIVPAYNAGATLGETLLSIRSQTYRNLEIIVVDDGSQDGTYRIAEQHAAEDSRIRLLRQKNAGVALARNKALEQATADFVAPVDADDLWRPEKIAEQLALIRDTERDIVLVYTWYASIDSASRIQWVLKPTQEGQVLKALCHGNFVGHASSPLMRTKDVIRAGGYDPSLRARGGQGCEDWQLYIRLAEIGNFALVKSPLTGYRDAAHSMSSDIAQMLRSYDLVMSACGHRHPELRNELHLGKKNITFHYLRKALNAAEFRRAFRTFIETCGTSPRLACGVLGMLELRHILKRLSFRKKFDASDPRPHFLAEGVPAVEESGNLPTKLPDRSLHESLARRALRSEDAQV